MQLEELLSKIELDIEDHRRSIVQLENKKQQISSLKNSIPNAIYNNGAVCLPNIWDKIFCMRIERKHHLAAARTDILAKFSIGSKYRVENKKIYSLPYENKIASISWKEDSDNKNKIFVSNINNLIDFSCPRRDAFIARIKIFLIKEIQQYNLSVNDVQYNFEISKLLMLR